MHETTLGAAGEYVIQNREAWDLMAADYVETGQRNWAADAPTWGIFDVPEETLDMLPSDMAGMDAIELGCGTAYVSAWMARRGARPVGIDNSPAQLESARRFQREFGLEFPLHLGNAEETPFADASFDFAISEYGAAIWCDPYAWVPEAHRILRPGGLLRFLGNHPFVPAFSPPDGSALVRELQRPYFGAHRFDWANVPVDPGGVEFNLTFEAWIDLFRRTGFVVEGFREPRPAPGEADTRFFVAREWATAWPSEQVWFLRKEPAA